MILSCRYFYGAIDGTPFSLGIALPDSYGVHELNAQQEIRHSHINGKLRCQFLPLSSVVPSSGK